MIDRRRGRPMPLAALAAAALALAACGTEDDPGAASFEDATPIDATTPDAAPPAAAAAPAAAAVAEAPASAQQADQPAVWPAADVVYATPEEAAADFVSSVLISDGDPSLGEFQQGDARSGEIDVLFAGETGDLDPPQTKGTLLLRQLGASDGWFVIAATSPGATIDTPQAGDTVAAGTLTVSGEGRGFEGTLNVVAFAPGDTGTELDLQIAAGGAFEELEPYSADLDLSATAEGDTVVVFVRGDTGLGNDPGTFAAIPVVVDASTTAEPTGDDQDDATAGDTSDESNDEATGVVIPETR